MSDDPKSAEARQRALRELDLELDRLRRERRPTRDRQEESVPEVVLDVILSVIRQRIIPLLIVSAVLTVLAMMFLARVFGRS